MAACSTGATRWLTSRSSRLASASRRSRLSFNVRRLKHMRDLFENSQLLRSSELRLEELSLCGVPYGCLARDFPVKKVSEVTLAPIVASSSWSTELGARYLDAGGRTLPLSEVIANAIEFSGVLHFPEGVSFGFETGRVQSFALYGASLNLFRHITSYTQFVKEFGTPDVAAPKEAFGDLMGYENYYKKCRKFVEWDEMGKKLSVINFGVGHRGPGAA
jgi:hypothetical protein